MLKASEITNVLKFLVIEFNVSACHPTTIVVGDADCSAVGTGLNPGEDMDVCKCIVPLRHGGTLNSRQAAKPLVRLVEGEERWEALDHPEGFLP
ncbi:uncharacterized protein TNCV_803711 [Trichonephila clavipes]|nr:uncharacterized protein TNCV_803711 [Trichonephila clavipes]